MVLLHCQHFHHANRVAQFLDCRGQYDLRQSQEHGPVPLVLEEVRAQPLRAESNQALWQEGSFQGAHLRVSAGRRRRGRPVQRTEIVHERANSIRNGQDEAGDRAESQENLGALFYQLELGLRYGEQNGQNVGSNELDVKSDAGHSELVQ